MRKNVGVRMGRPPQLRSTVAAPPSRGVKPAPMDNYDSATPAAAYSRGGGVMGCKPMPKHHDDPGFCSGGSTRRR